MSFPKVHFSCLDNKRVILLFCSWLAIPGCFAHKSPDSLVKVTNGTLDLGDTGVLLIQSVNSTTGEKYTCTAVLVRPDALLTAAHCVQERSTGEQRQIQVALPDAPKVKSVQVHPRYEPKLRFDVALVLLDRPILGKQVVPLANKPAKKSDPVRLVGFGDNQTGTLSAGSSGSGVKRTGYATVTATDETHIYSRGIGDAKPQTASRPTGIDSAAAHGDSGGPLLNLNGELLGIAAAINVSSRAAEVDTERPILNAFTSVESVRDFIVKNAP